MKMYDVTLMDELLGFVKQHEIICIADEVMTGFGRTGKLFAGEYLAEKADIICLSKGLTGGTMALGVTACNNKIYDAFVNDDIHKIFFHGHSFTANPLACTAAIASLDLLMKEDCMRQIEWVAEKNKWFATKNMNKAVIKNIRTLGTILAFEIDKGRNEYLNNISGAITQKSLAAGVYLRPLGNTVYIMPPYCITENELEKVYGVIESIVEEYNV
jgi:adenosylmethionine-8-amino-7-oxononanoate aminotransferase